MTATRTRAIGPERSKKLKPVIRRKSNTTRKRKPRRKNTNETLKNLPPLKLHAFRKFGNHDSGECDSVYCPGIGNENKLSMRWIQCRKCLAVVHPECLGILPKQELDLSFTCSGCKNIATSGIILEKYKDVRRKTRRCHNYAEMIVKQRMTSWRMQQYVKGGRARQDLKYNLLCEFVDDDQVEYLLKTLREWLKEWHIRFAGTDEMKFCLDVLMPEVLIHIVMDTEGIHRDHAEFLYYNFVNHSS